MMTTVMLLLTHGASIYRVELLNTLHGPLHLIFTINLEISTIDP